MEEYSLILTLCKCKTEDGTSFISDHATCLFIAVVTVWQIEVDYSRYITYYGSLSIACMHHDYDVELANVEEVKDGTDLVFGHVWGQYE